MAVRIRLTRVGATKRPAYRVIAIDQRRSRDGRAIEILGTQVAPAVRKAVGARSGAV